MIVAACLVASLAVPTIDESNRVRKVLDSGAIAVVEPIPSARTVAVQLFAAAKGCQESPEKHGWRHLLEHLVVKGRNATLGERLEARSWIATAETYRDFMVVRLEGPPEGFEAAIEALGEVLRPDVWSTESIDRERLIIAQELSLLSPSAKVSVASWSSSFGDGGLDPIGNTERISMARASDLVSLHERCFAADNLTLSVAGQVDAKRAADTCVTALKNAPKPLKANWEKRGQGSPGSVETPDGSAIFAPAPGFANPLTAWMLAGALAIASENRNRFAVYTPSLQNGLVIVGGSESEDLNAAWASVSSRPDVYFEVGKQLARAWFARSRHTTSEVAFSNGSFQVQALGGRPETLLDNIEDMRLSDFIQGLQAFRRRDQ